MRPRSGVSDVVAAIALVGIALVVSAITFHALASYVKSNVPRQEPELFSASIVLVSRFVDYNGTIVAVYSVQFTAFSPENTNATVCITSFDGSNPTPVNVTGSCKSVWLVVGTKDYHYTAYVPLSWLASLGCEPSACPDTMYWELWLYVDGQPVDAIKLT